MVARSCYQSALDPDYAQEWPCIATYLFERETSKFDWIGKLVSRYLWCILLLNDYTAAYKGYLVLNLLPTAYKRGSLRALIPKRCHTISHIHHKALSLCLCSVLG